jgi:hypothetical protein
MGLDLSLPVLVASAGADVIKIVLDLPDGPLDQLFRAAAENGWVAKTRRDRIIQAGMLIAAWSVVDQQFGPGHFAQFVRKTLDKSHADLAKRFVVGDAPRKE